MSHVLLAMTYCRSLASVLRYFESVSPAFFAPASESHLAALVSARTTLRVSSGFFLTKSVFATIPENST